MNHRALATTLVVVAMVAAGCSATDRASPPTATPTSPAPTSTSTPTASPSPSASPTPTGEPTPPLAVREWAAPEGEVHRAVKEAAARVALALTTYDTGTDVGRIAARVVDGAKEREQLVGAAAALHHDDRWSRGRIVYPQMGGLTEDAASVMVVIEQTTAGAGSPVRVETRTLDLRLSRGEGGWRFDRLASDGGSPEPRPPDLPPEASAVLDDPRIDLPDSARWDIHRGRVSETLLAVMADLADQTPYGVVTLAAGHPRNVFGTDRRSSHTRGHAVDIHVLGDERVVDGRAGDDTRTREVVEWLYEDPRVTNVGSPWSLDDYGGRSFTDPVHQDHLHVSAPDSMPRPNGSPS